MNCIWVIIMWISLGCIFPAKKKKPDVWCCFLWRIGRGPTPMWFFPSLEALMRLYFQKNFTSWKGGIAGAWANRDIPPPSNKLPRPLGESIKKRGTARPFEASSHDPKPFHHYDHHYGRHHHGQHGRSDRSTLVSLGVGGCGFHPTWRRELCDGKSHPRWFEKTFLEETILALEETSDSSVLLDDFNSIQSD